MESNTSANDVSRIVLLASLGSSTVLGGLAQLAVAPNLTSIANDFSVNMTIAALTLSVFSISQAVAQIFYGPLADRFAPQRLLVYSLFAFFIFTIGVAFAPNIGLLILLRGAQAAMSAGILILSTVLGASWFRRRDRTRAMGALQIGSAFGAASGLVNASVFGSLAGWRYTFVVPACVSLLSIILHYYVMTRTPEMVAASHRTVPRMEETMLAANASTLNVSAISLTQYYGVFTFQALLPIVYANLTPVPSWSIGFLMALIPISVMTGSWLGGRLTGLHDRRQFVLRSAVGAALACAAIPLVLGPKFPALLVISLALTEVILGLSVGSGVPGQLALVVEHFPDHQGAASSIYYVARSLGMFAAPVTGSLILSASGFGLAFLAAAALNILVFFTGIRFVRDAYSPVLDRAF